MADDGVALGGGGVPLAAMSRVPQIGINAVANEWALREWERGLCWS